METTNRGFEIVKFQDRNGVECSLQQSSETDCTSPPGAAFLWLGCNDADPKEFAPYGNPSWRSITMPKGYVANTRMHLDRANVEMLVRQLQHWLQTGTFE